MGLGRASSIVIRVVFIMFSIDSAKEAPSPQFWGLQNHAPPELGAGGPPGKFFNTVAQTGDQGAYAIVTLKRRSRLFQRQPERLRPMPLRWLILDERPQ